MKHAACYLICGLGLLFAACRKETAEDSAPSAERIYLRATVANRTATRAPYYITAPQREKPLVADVWASTTPYEFKNVPGANGQNNTDVALHTTAKFTNGTGQLLYDAVYPNQGNTSALVYFVGLHPTGWTTPAAGDPLTGKTAACTFTGCEDVMFAPQISGKYAENVDEKDWPEFRFHHLLTWLKVRIKADGEAVSEAWGKLKSLKIESKYTVTVDLREKNDKNAAYDPAKPEERVAFPDDATPRTKEFDFYKTGTDQAFVNPGDEKSWYELPYDDRNVDTVAYVLCAPVDATDEIDTGGDGTLAKTTEYTLLVETEFRKVEVPVDLRMEKPSSPDVEQPYFEGSTMSRQFIINLLFKMGNNIAVSAAVTDWQTGGLGSEWLNPDPDNPGGSTDPANP